jgi:hypothetical protein
MRYLLTLIAFATMIGCDPPSQADPARFGTISVYIDPEWLQLDKARIRDELALLDALGPHFVDAGEGGRSTARVVVQPFDSQGCTLGAGRWIVGSRIVEVDPTCTAGFSAFGQAIGHEIGHALGMQHVCARPGDAHDCSPVGFGPAMMAPSLGGGGESFSPELAQEAPTELDLAEYRRASGL